MVLSTRYWYRYIILFCSQLFGPGTMRRKLEPGAGWVHCSLHCVSDAHRTPDARVRVKMMMTMKMIRRRRRNFVRYNSDNHHHKPHTNISPSPIPILGALCLGSSWLQPNNHQYPIPIPILQNHQKTLNITSSIVGCFHVVVWEVVGYFQFPRLSAG